MKASCSMYEYFTILEYESLEKNANQTMGGGLCFVTWSAMFMSCLHASIIFTLHSHTNLIGGLKNCGFLLI